MKILCTILLLSTFLSAQPLYIHGAQSGNILVKAVSIKLPTVNTGDTIALGLTIGGIAGPAIGITCEDMINHIFLNSCVSALNNSYPEVDLYGFYGTAFLGGSTYKCSWQNTISATTLQGAEFSGVSRVNCGAMAATGTSSPASVSMSADDPEAFFIGFLSAVNQPTTITSGTTYLKRLGNPQTVMAGTWPDADGNLLLEGTFPNAAWAAIGMELLP
jgi:hypothetical protein